MTEKRSADATSSDTPRSDALEFRDGVVGIEFARQLERELAQKEADRQYHMNAINRLARELGALGMTSDAVIQVAMIAIRSVRSEIAPTDKFDFYCAAGDCSDQCDPCREDGPGPQAHPSSIGKPTDQEIIAAFSNGASVDDTIPTHQPHAPLLTNEQIIWVVRRFMAGSAAPSAIAPTTDARLEAAYAALRDACEYFLFDGKATVGQRLVEYGKHAEVMKAVYRTADGGTTGG